MYPRLQELLHRCAPVVHTWGSSIDAPRGRRRWIGSGPRCAVTSRPARKALREKAIAILTRCGNSLQLVEDDGVDAEPKRVEVELVLDDLPDAADLCSQYHAPFIFYSAEWYWERRSEWQHDKTRWHASTFDSQCASIRGRCKRRAKPQKILRFFRFKQTLCRGTCAMSAFVSLLQLSWANPNVSMMNGINKCSNASTSFVCRSMIYMYTKPVEA